MLEARLLKEYKQYFTHQHMDDLIAMFCHPFMAHHGLHLMMNKACVIDENLYENMKEAFIDDVLKMMKILEDNEQDDNSSNGNISHDAGIVHADDVLESSILIYMFNNLEGEVAWDWLIL